MNSKGIAKRGDKKVPVRVWNRMVRAVAGLQSNRPPSSPSEPGLGFVQSTLLIKNSTGQDIPAWRAVSLGGMVATPSAPGTQNTATATFLSTPVAAAQTPSEANDHTFVVTLQKIRNNTVGVAAAAGIVPVVVEVVNADDKYVATSPGYDTLKTGPAGEAAILWKQSGTGSGKWALIRLGHAQPGVVRGTFSGSWTKGTTKTVAAGNSQYTAKNYFATVTSTGTRACAIARAGSEWILIAAEC